MANLEKRKCTCGKEFEVSKFAPKATVCPDCAIARIAAKRKEKRPPAVEETVGPPEYEVGGASVTKDELDTDPFAIISVYNLFGKEAIYVWLLLRGFKVSNSGMLFKQYDSVYIVAPLNRHSKFIVSTLNTPNNDITIDSVEDVEELPNNMLVDLLPISSMVWPKGQGGPK